MKMIKSLFSKVVKPSNSNTTTTTTSNNTPTSKAQKQVPSKPHVYKHGEDHYVVWVCEAGRDSDIQQFLEAQRINAPIRTFVHTHELQEHLESYLPNVLAILIHSGGLSFTDHKLAGDLMYNYVEQGGNLVLTLFSNYDTSNGMGSTYALGGAFEKHHLHPFTYTPNYNYYALQLGKIHIATHPTLLGVKNTNNMLNVPCKLTNNSIAIADWSDNQPFIAEKQVGASKIIGLNMVAASKKSFSNFWDAATTDCALLLKNCLEYAAQRSKSPQITQQKLLLLMGKLQYTDMVIEYK